MKRGSQPSGREGPSLLQPNEIKLTDQPGPSMPINEAELSAAFDFFDMSGQVCARALLAATMPLERLSPPSYCSIPIAPYREPFPPLRLVHRGASLQMT